MNLTPGDEGRNYYSLIGMGMPTSLVGTMMGAPAVMTALAESLAQVTGRSIETVLMLQVPSWMFFPLPYEIPALVVAIAMGGIRIGQAVLLLTVFTIFGILVALPLHFIWLQALGYFG